MKIARHQIMLEQLENGDLNEDERLIAIDELYKQGLLEDWQLLQSEDVCGFLVGQQTQPTLVVKECLSRPAVAMSSEPGRFVHRSPSLSETRSVGTAKASVG